MSTYPGSRLILRCIMLTTLWLTIFPIDSAQAQGEKFRVKGKILDSLSTAPLGFATIRVFNSVDKKLVDGNISGETGDFFLELPGGNYYAEVDFMGYNSHKTAEFILSKDHTTHDIGIISIGPSTQTLNEVVVQAEQSSMELSLDKRIFNVGKDLANAGGSANDILMNIPSVSVDPDGAVKLRGSDNVRILIDGKPSGLVSFKGGSGLQQLQASMVERVEIITNPSARYEAEGMAGIINIVLKKERNQGFNGSFDIITGHPVNYGAAANLNYRHKKINFFINYAIAYRETPGDGNIYQEVYDQNTTSILKQTTDSYITGFNNNIRGGLDYFFSEKNILTASYLFRRADAGRITKIRYEDYLSNTENLQSYTNRRQDEDEIEPNSEYSLIYKRSFAQQGHDLTAEVKYLDNWEKSDQLFTQQTYDPDGTLDSSSVQTSVNDESEKQFLFQLDYVKPIGKEGKFETGVRSSFRDMVNDYVVSQQNAEGGFEPMPGLDNVFLYDENIHAVFGILGNKTKRFSYQAGLRTEWTEVTTTLEETNEVNPRKYVNLFPSAHVTLDLPKENAFQVSYSRRVKRPFYNDLSPFMTYSDSRNYFSGNPDLNPEYSDVFEVGHIKYFENATLSSSLYYRDTEGKIERIRSVDSETGQSTTQPENLNGEKSGGVEFTAGYTPIKWWKLDFNFNFFHSEIDGSNIDESYQATTNSWFTRLTQRFTLTNNFDIQLRGNYEAPQKTAQGERKSLYYVDLSMSKDVMKGRGTIFLNVLDVFNTRRMRSVMTGESFYTESDFQFRRRQINLTFSYRIKQAKQAKKVATSDD